MHIHELGADIAAVRFAQRVQQFGKRHGVAPEKGIAGVEYGVRISVGEAVKTGQQLRNIRACFALQRVKLRPARANSAVRSNELLHGGVFAPVCRFFGCGIFCGVQRGCAGVCACGKCLNHWRVRHIARCAVAGGGLQRVKILAP